MGCATSVPTSDHVPEQIYAVASRSAGIPAMADAVSWQAGAMSSVSRNAASAVSEPCSLPGACPAQQCAVRLQSVNQARENVGCPVAGCKIDKAGVRGVGVLGNSRRAEPVKNKLRQAKPGSVRDTVIGQKLVDAVDSQWLRPVRRKASSGGSKLSAFAFAAIVRSSR